jgi:hypothetical protein
MINVLPNLYNCAPCVGGKLFLAIIALHIDFNELSDKSLLHFSLIVQFLLNGKFDLYSLGVGLSPNKPCFENFSFVKPFNFFEEK